MLSWKQKLTGEIASYVKKYQEREDVHTEWGEPLVGFADACSPYIQKLPEIVSKTHALPQDVMEDASIVLVYYVPFTRELARTNRTGTHLSSPEWARAYEETNAMFGQMNSHLIEIIEDGGYKAAIAPQSAVFDREKLISDWSFRHFARAAGLGTFGINNMLITKKGCCGRYNTIVTNLDVEPDSPVEEEYCLYKKNGSCGICMKNCPAGALKPDSFDRNLCYSVLKENAEVYTDFGSSYTGSSEGDEEEGSEVCGKCVTQSPCAFWNLK
jgi:epoxyqueuosine reductase QueG